jgi:hypothetical protein
VVSTGHGEPADVEDRLLWRNAQETLGRHAAPDPGGLCVWCGSPWPCPPRRLAEHAEAAARRPWRESWTARHDINGSQAPPRWRASDTEHEDRLATNLGLFDQQT